MKYIVLDLEYNQAFNFGNGQNKPTDEKCPFEIIQIGAVRLGSDFKYEDSLNLLIKPVIYKKLHPYVARITGLNSAAFKNKKSFREALFELNKFAGNKDVIYCVWGANDIKELRKNMDFYGLSDKSTNINFIDVQSIASRHLNHITGMGIGLKKAVAALEIEMDKPFHDALNDAEYTAKILQVLKDKPLRVMQFTHDGITKTLAVPKRRGLAMIFNLGRVSTNGLSLFAKRIFRIFALLRTRIFGDNL